MKKIISSTKNWFRKLSRTKIVIIIIVLILLALGFLLFRPKAPVYQFVTVEKKNIVETVSVTGNTTPISSVSLGFGNSGNVQNVYASVGQSVSAGQVLAELNASDLYAQLKQAQANLSLQIAESHNTVTSVEQVTKQQDILVENAHRTLLSDNLQAVPDDVTTTLSAPVITGTYTGGEGEYMITIYAAIGPSGAAFQYSGLESGSEEATINQVPLGTHGLYIQFGSADLRSYVGSKWIVTIPNTKSSTYNANHNAYIAAEANREKAISDAQAQIDSHTEGSTVSEAQIANAQAGVQSVEAKLQNSRIIAPISGVVTLFDAKVGQFASPGSTLVSIISANSFEVDALVSETDVGKIAINNKIAMTFDAFPNETFGGSVFYIDPAQTTSDGVVGYKIKVAFDKADPRMKSGLTANLDIETRSKENVLTLPQYAILQNDDGTFVEVLENKIVKDIPVMLGLQDKDGNVEIVSGVTEGEQVLNIGLKTK